MKEETKKRYEAPCLTVVHCRTERGYAVSTLASAFGLSTWIYTGGDAWSNDTPTESGNSIGGWTDNGGSAWI